MKDLFQTLKDGLQVMQSIATIIALIVGAIWGLYLYNQQRQDKPQLNIDHHILSVQLGPGYRLLHVAVIHENRGNILIELGDADIRIQQVDPLPRQIASALAEGEDPVIAGESVVRWPLLCRRLSTVPLELEPHETHESVQEFIIPDHVETMKIYTYYPNARKQNVGWYKTTIYHVDKGVEDDATPPQNRPAARHVCADGTSGQLGHSGYRPARAA